jgi:small subunit ribosomal protein S17
VTDEIQPSEQNAGAPVSEPAVESASAVIEPSADIAGDTVGIPTRGERKVRQGVVASNKMQKTVVVRVDRSVRHPLYGRIVRSSRTFKAHDEHNECNVGDRVEIRETRPLSKEKRWRVSRIIERAR